MRRWAHDRGHNQASTNRPAEQHHDLVNDRFAPHADVRYNFQQFSFKIKVSRLPDGMQMVDIDQSTPDRHVMPNMEAPVWRGFGFLRAIWIIGTLMTPGWLTILTVRSIYPEFFQTG